MSESLEEIRLKAEISKLKAETEKLELETLALKRPIFFRPAAFVPVLVGLMTIAGSISQWYQTNEQLKVTTADNRGLQSFNKGLEKSLEIKATNQPSKIQKSILEQWEKNPDLLNNLDKKSSEELKVVVKEITESSSNDSILPTRVSIQFRGSITRELITSLQETFNSLGMPAPRPERIAENYKNSIRYYYPQDSKVAQEVKKVTEEFFDNNGCSLKTDAKLMTGYEDSVKNGVIEVWIHHSCN